MLINEIIIFESKSLIIFCGPLIYEMSVGLVLKVMIKVTAILGKLA
jgi:hypothetical protein